MIILDLELENYGIIKAAKIDTGGKPVVELAGLNAQGKSTVLSAIESVLLGTKYLPEQPIRHGEKEARMVLGTERFEVHQVVGQKKSKIEVFDKATGASIASPRTFLADLLKPVGGKTVAIDPIDFVQSKPKDRTELILETMGALDKVHAIELEYKEEYEARTALNRDAKKAKAAMSGKMHDPSLPTELVDMQDLVAELEAAEAVNADRANLLHALERGRKRREELETQIMALQNELENTIIPALQNCEKEYDSGSDVDTVPIKERMQKVSETNQKIFANKEFLRLQNEYEEARTASEQATARLEELLNEKRELLDPSKLPLPSLSFDNEGNLLVNGVPFDQASQAEQYEVATALAFAKDPELKVVLLRNGGLIGDEILSRMERVAVEAGGQLWVERPLRNKGHYEAAARDGAIIIEAGEIIDVSSPEIPEAAEAAEKKEPAPAPAKPPKRELPF